MQNNFEVDQDQSGVFTQHHYTQVQQIGNMESALDSHLDESEDNLIFDIDD